MNVGDAVRVLTSRGVKYGILITPGRKKYMVGPVVEVLVDGSIQSYLQEKVTVVRKEQK